MIRVEYAPEFNDPRNPLIPKVNPNAYTDLLRVVGIPDMEIPKRRIRISPYVPIENDMRILAKYNPNTYLVSLYPGAHYPKYLEDLASTQEQYKDFSKAQQVSGILTEELHANLAQALAHEAKHDGDNHARIDPGVQVIRYGLSSIVAATGSLTGIYLSSLAEGTQSEIGLGIGLIVGVVAGASAGISDRFVYSFDPLEIRARMFEKESLLGIKERLINTTQNPNVDLNYRHRFPKADNLGLSISNRQILDLRFGD